MAQLSKAAFLSKWATIFADNVTRDISEEDMRDFRQDIADSFYNNVDSSLGGITLVVSTTLSQTLTAVDSVYVFTGANNATWTLPAISGNSGIRITIKNKTAFNVTLESNGSNEIWDYEQADSRVIGSGESRTYINDGTHWTQI